MTEQDEKQLWMEIEHIFDSGANELRVFNMVKGFIEKRYQTLPQTTVSVSPIKHQLEYSIWSCKVSWCPICRKHFYNERNEIHTTKATSEHYHLLDCH